MKREERGRLTRNPNLQNNDAELVFKFSHHRPLCQKCLKKTVTFYTRSRNRGYISSGYYCLYCDMIVKTMNTAPPVVHRMDIQKYLNSANEKFDVILADPPWTYDIEAMRKSDRISSHYNQMTTQDICNLPVHNVSKKGSYLFLWCTSPKLNEGLTVLRSWDYKYLTQMVWDKELMGLGHVVRQQHEILLIGRKGHPKPPAIKFRSVIREKRTDHSRKPEKSYEIINTMFPDARKIELFARWVYPGWAGIGLEAEPKPDDVHAKSSKKCMQKFEVEVV